MNPSRASAGLRATKEDQNQHPSAQSPAQPEPPRESEFGPVVRLRSLDKGLDEELKRQWAAYPTRSYTATFPGANESRPPSRERRAERRARSSPCTAATCSSMSPAAAARA